MGYEKPTIVTLALAELENAHIFASLFESEGSGCQCQCQCQEQEQCQCQCQGQQIT